MIIDPQGQANKFIKHLEKEKKINIITQSKISEKTKLIVENCIIFGTPLLLENIGETIDHFFEPILSKKNLNNSLFFRNREIDCSPNFNFYITTMVLKLNFYKKDIKFNLIENFKKKIIFLSFYLF